MRSDRAVVRLTSASCGYDRAVADSAYRVFLGHSGKDKEFVRELYRRLKRDGVSCFFNAESIGWGENWSRLSSARSTSAAARNIPVTGRHSRDVRPTLRWEADRRH